VSTATSAQRSDAAQRNKALRAAYGTVVKEPGCLCGDVYELPNGTRYLPEFGNMESIGQVYTHSLDVPHHHDDDGVPGVTSRTEFYGIDYYGIFWIKVPGIYHFKITSDDGSQIWIDDNKVVDNDGVHSDMDRAAAVQLAEGLHTIHVPYFQETNFVALSLQVQAPGENFKVFDLRDFSNPATTQP